METSTSSTLSPMLMASSVSSLSPQTVWIFSPLILSPASPVRLLWVQASPPLDSLLIGVLFLLWTMVCSASSGLSWRLGTADPSEMSLPVSILLVNFFFNTCLIQADTIGLSFTADSLLLHQGYKTVAVTSMGMVITTLLRKVYCVEVASSSDFLVTSG